MCALRAPGVPMPMLIGFLRMESEAYAERAAGVLSVDAKSTSPAWCGRHIAVNWKLPVDKPPG
jgi:hypothetical protein